MSTATKLGVFAAAVVLGLAVLGGVVWGVAGRPASGRVAGHTVLAGRSVGGMSTAKLTALVAALQHEYAQASVKVVAPEATFDTTTASLGAAVDDRATVRAAMAVGRGGSLPGRVFGWISSLSTPRRVAVRLHFDPTALRNTLQTDDNGPHSVPTEPTLQVGTGAGSFFVKDGSPGQGIDLDDAVSELTAAVGRPSPMTIHVSRGQIPPRFTRADAEAVARQANDLVADPLTITAGGASAKVDATTMRPWLRFDPTTDGLHLAVDEAKVSTDLPNVLAAATKPAVETSFVVDGDAVVVHPGTSGLVCCDAAAPAAIAKALLSSPRPSDPVALQLRPLAPKIPPEEIAKVGISKPVGTFTVTYRPEKTKSLDVQLAADNLRGRVVLPGETFSMNVALGQPTPERGFQTRVPRSTPAAFADDVLGSLNDLANSMFNASFVGGLDLFSYRTRPVHSTTYPSGREVDVGWPTPDLQIRNSTPYGVLLWITYTDSSVTVTLWSTPTFASVVQSNQTSTPDGPCTRVVTERTKTLLDGTQQVDSISAIYQPDAATKCPSG